jgi:hypothetical protein
MLNPKQVTLDSEEAYGNDLRACLRIKIIQYVIIKGTKKQRVGDENARYIKVTWIPPKILS